MRIVIICIIVAAAALAAILLIETEESMVARQAAESMAESAENPPQTTLAPIAKAAEEEATDLAHGESGPSEAAEETAAAAEPSGEPAAKGTQDATDHAKQMAHAMAAQHAEHARAAQGEPQVHWGYQGSTGPDHWGQLSPEFAVCGSGRNQSPVNLAGFVEAELPALTFNYAGMVVEIRNNGHTVQADYHPGSTLAVDGRIFHLKQFHFHAPSENLVNGRSYPLEAHFVHADEDGELAVVAVLFEDGQANRALGILWDQLPEHAGTGNILAGQVRAEDLLPKNRDYYRYNGSLTTPPCSQGVIWLVMKQPLTVSVDQVARFAEVMGGPNNRPVQPLNARTVLQ